MVGLSEENQDQQCICILMERSSHYIAVIFAAWRVGLFVVPLNTSWPLQKNIEIINRMKPSIVAVDDGLNLDIDFNCISKSVLFSNKFNMEVLDSEMVSKAKLLPSDIAYDFYLWIYWRAKGCRNSGSSISLLYSMDPTLFFKI